MQRRAVAQGVDQLAVSVTELRVNQPVGSPSHRLTQYHGELFHGFRSVLGAPGAEKLDSGAVHGRSLGNQAGVGSLFGIRDGVRNGGQRARSVRGRFPRYHPGIARSLLQDAPGLWSIFHRFCSYVVCGRPSPGRLILAHTKLLVPTRRCRVGPGLRFSPWPSQLHALSQRILASPKYFQSTEVRISWSIEEHPLIAL